MKDIELEAVFLLGAIALFALAYAVNAAIVGASFVLGLSAGQVGLLGFALLLGFIFYRYFRS